MDTGGNTLDHPPPPPPAPVPPPPPGPLLGSGPPAAVQALGEHLTEGLLLVRDAQVVASLTRPQGLLGHGDRVGTHTLEHTHPDDLAEVLGVAATVIDGAPGTQETMTVRLRGPDGTWARYAADIVNCEDDPRLEGLLVRTRTLHDGGPTLSEVDTDGVLRTLVDAMPAGVILLERYGHVLHVNARAAALFSTTPDRMRGRRLDAVVTVTDGEGADIAEVLDGVCRDSTERDLALVVADDDDDERQLRIRLLSQDGAMILAIVDDITEQAAREADLRHLASYDALTGLDNSRTTRQAVADLVADDGRTGDGPFVVYCDIDGFKAVNDRLGHVGGDEVLVALAHRIREVVGELGSVGRLGGDELLVACPDLDDDTAALLVERLAAVSVDGLGPDQAPVTISLGCARPEPGDDAMALIARADAEMYRRKRRRRTGAP